MVILPKKTKYNENSGMKNVSKMIKFWISVFPFFLDKTSSPAKASLSKNDKIISEVQQVAEKIISSFENRANALNIKPKSFTFGDTTNLNNHVEVATKRFESHTIFLAIKRCFLEPLNSVSALVSF